MIIKEFIQHVNNVNIPNLLKKYSDSEFNVMQIENPDNNKIKLVVFPSGLNLKDKKNLRKIFRTDLAYFTIQVLPFTSIEFILETKKKQLKKEFRFINYEEQIYRIFNYKPRIPLSQT